MGGGVLQQMAGAVAQLMRDVIDIKASIARLNQQPLMASGPGQGGGGGGAAYFECDLPAGLAHGTATSSPVTIYKRVSGSRATAGTATVYNNGPNPADDITAGSVAILLSNGDGTYSVIGVYC